MSTPTPEGARAPESLRPAGLDLADLHAANIARQAEWCPDQVPDLSFRGNELGGECGEAQNVIKKLERERLGWRGSRATLDDLAKELADVVICADLCAITAGVDLAAAVRAKFNATSETVGLSTRLEAPSTPTDPTGVSAQDERAAICAELGCIDKPGVPLDFVRKLRADLSKAFARNTELIRSWDPATPTERQELDRMRRGWGPSSPTERERRRNDVACCLSALSIAMTDLSVGEDEDVPEEARDRLDEAYERVSKQHAAVLAALQALVADPQEWPDIKAAEERGAAQALEALGSGLEGSQCP